MSLPLAIALYCVIWWTVLFAVLPFGVRTQGEEGAVVPGSVESAPVRPHLLKKAIWTTVIATIVFAIVYAAIASGLVDLGNRGPAPP
jgi:predicted secreted protein